ncbi:sphingomyelin phosphodiesterase-like isoform X2 [Ischnura elegans]|uniref:sphingomyelin phosphodiesterase-like isoform X2 n=1 Tax=Ischnura elegans TaxID=197161 RepID=UPI001ED8AB86|nr:sphingomyelin phosphodiesterase-like isoform X2 [Ischnura elegans]
MDFKRRTMWLASMLIVAFVNFTAVAASDTSSSTALQVSPGGGPGYSYRAKRSFWGEGEHQVTGKSRSKRSILEGLTCVGCRAAFTGLRTMVTLRQSEYSMKKAASFACKTLRFQTDKVCDAIMEQYVPEFAYILKTRPNVDAPMVCSIVLQGYACNSLDPRLDWSVTLPPPPRAARSYRGRGKIRSRKMVASSSQARNDVVAAGPYKVIHLTDIHWDPQYVEGSVSNCPDPLCCRAESTTDQTPVLLAGHWGDYGSCDIPWRTVESALEHASKVNGDAEWIIMTGDLTPHAIWTSSQEENMMIVQRLNEAISKAFPNKPVYPTIGNHEAHPLNSFSPVGISRDLSTAWLYEAAAKAWSKWLPEEALVTVRKGGYYSVTPKPGLRIIAINSNLCYTLNWWQIYDHVDPSGMLKWMINELQDAESKGQKVHILGHLPPGYVDCWSVWSREFMRIVNRYREIIITQFYGHTHYEEYKVGFDQAGHPSSTSWIGGSVSTYTDLNPNYKIFYVDRDTWNLVDHETWIFNLTEANQNPTQSPRWYRSILATKDFGVASLSPNDLYQHTLRMVEDEALFQRMYGYYVKNGDSALAKGCDKKCKEEILCGFLTMDYGDQSHCDLIKARMQTW